MFWPRDVISVCVGLLANYYRLYICLNTLLFFITTLLSHYGVPWILKYPHKNTQHLRTAHEISRLLLKPQDCSWNLRTASETSKGLLKPQNCSWNLKTAPETSERHSQGVAQGDPKLIVKVFFMVDYWSLGVKEHFLTGRLNVVLGQFEIFKMADIALAKTRKYL